MEEVLKFELKEILEGMTSSSGGSSEQLVSGRPEKSVARGGENAEEPREGGQESVVVEKRGDFAAGCRWTIGQFTKTKARTLWSRYFEVGGYDCRLLVYPKGDSQALPGYFSIYLQITDPRGSSSSKWDCFASYRLCIVNQNDDSKSIQRDSWHRFSSKKKSHGWCDFTPSSTILDTKSGLLSNDSMVITADILVLHESVSFSRDIDFQAVAAPVPDVLSGKFTWKVQNFSLFKEMIKTQKIMSPVFPAGECNLRISVYQSSVNGVEYLSMCLESKDTEKSAVQEKSCWCLFRMSVLNQRAGSNHMHRDSYGRFAADNKSGDNTSLGWNDYMKMSDFLSQDMGYLVDNTATFCASFHVIKETNSFSKNAGQLIGRVNARKSDGHLGKFTWRIENFTRLKDLLKKRKITGLCVKSKRFQIGNRDCRLIVYPRGQSQPPYHLSVFLEVTDSRNTSNDWSCFVSHRLSVVNQKIEDKSVTKESQNRYSKAAKDWGWREFVTLTSLFDQDAGFLVQDTVVFSAEVLILKETSMMQEFPDQENEINSGGSLIDAVKRRAAFTWKVENFLSFKEIMETRKIFSKFFQAGGCELRIGVYESFDTICIYLESDQSGGNDFDKNFWVRYRMAVVNQKKPSNTVWKESSICTKTWNNSVLQFMKVSDMLEADAGFLVRDTVVFVCEILDCCPWFEFADLEVLASDDDQDALSTDPDELIDSEDSEGISGDEEDIFKNLLARAGVHLSYGENPSQPQVTLREKLLMDAGAIAGFLTGLRVYLDDPMKVKRLLLPTKLSGIAVSKKDAGKGDAGSPSLMNLLMGVKVLQQAIIDLLLDIMVECCQPSEANKADEASDERSKYASGSISACSLEPVIVNEVIELTHFPVQQRLDTVQNEVCNAQAVQSSDMKSIDSLGTFSSHSSSPPETSASDALADDMSNKNAKTKWPEQSEELLGLIVNSLRALDGAVPHGCPEPRRRPQSAQKIALILDRAPKHLKPDLVALVPKLVDYSEHPLAAYALLDRIQKPDAEPSLRLPVLSALGQLEFGAEVWEKVLCQALELLPDSNDEPLAAAISFVFRAASQCQHMPQAVRAIRCRLKSLGVKVSDCVLDVIRKAAIAWPDAAETMLRDIDSNPFLVSNCMTESQQIFACDQQGITVSQLSIPEDQVAVACHQMSDIFILFEMLSIPSLAMEASHVFERAVAQGAIGEQAMVLVLERRHSQRLIATSQMVLSSQNKDILVTKPNQPLSEEDDDFVPVLSLAEVLASSRNSRVQEFVRMLYAIMFKIYDDEVSRGRMLKGLVERVTSTTDSCHDLDLDLEILLFLVHEEGIVRPVLSMMREVAELANVDRAALWHQLCANEEEKMRTCEKKQAEISGLAREKNILCQKLSESESLSHHLKSEWRAEIDRFARERKEMAEQIREAENQIEWVRSERDDEVAKISAEKKVLQDRLHDAEVQLAQLKSRKRDELKRVVKEKNALAERLKNAEAARKRFDEELKRFATETVTREEVRQSLEDEVQRLTKTVGQTEGEKREKEEQIARCEAYIDGMESKLNTCQQYIHTLEASLQEEMSRHAPLYGVGLEALSMQELETLSRIHEEGLRLIHAFQQRIGSSSPLITSHPVPSPLGLYGTAPPMAVGLSPSILPSGAAIHSNGHVNGVGSPWFPST
ncbi:Ubiquitin carboxyl-terminal hydrolase 13 [Nymphaea thermarum]|nr:Ubiquitin carboxyl-terminal hydrolase 13 [Nymphaea thermarum]